ncbi:hypothetical protein KJ708_01190 [bacterium]|nr:hypothetical protein [bacterium]MBU1916981.1 hypothetical protein [bacterium]
MIKELECKIFDVQNQKHIDCIIIENYSENYTENNFSDDGVAWGVEPPKFPEHYYNLGLINNREIPAESARDYFLALECEGIVFDNPEEQNIALRQDKFTVITDIELQLNFITSKNKAFCFKTNVFRLDPCLHPNRTEL